MGKIYPDNSMIAWCEHCQSQTVFDTANSDDPVCTVCAIHLLSTLKDEQ